jgi:F-type H+-transporting ATPase subunit epsilon
VAIATREAHPGDDLDRLEAEVVAGYRRGEESERTERTAAAKLRMQAIRRMVAALDGKLPEIGA